MACRVPSSLAFLVAPNLTVLRVREHDYANVIANPSSEAALFAALASPVVSADGSESPLPKLRTFRFYRACRGELTPNTAALQAARPSVDVAVDHFFE